MKTLFVGVLLLAGCGQVADKPLLKLGVTCAASGDCASGSCVDGVCCDTACDGECVSCVGAKTGGADGTCTPVTANTDPEAECGAGTCTATSVVHSACSGTSAACAMTATQCGYFACDSTTVACSTACTDNTGCSATGFCNAAQVCGKRLRIALEAPTNSCTRTEALPRVKAALEARGHTVTVVEGLEIDTEAELANFDVVVAGSVGACGNDIATYDALLPAWVNAGGGLVGSGWVLYNNNAPANFTGLMPKVSANNYFSGAQAVTFTGTHPIVTGLTGFTENALYLPYGGPEASGGIPLALVGTTDVAVALEQGSGRVVFNGMLHIDGAGYTNQSLTDGTNPGSLEFFLRCIEWAGKGL